MSARGPAGHRREGRGNPLKSDGPCPSNPSRQSGRIHPGGKFGYLKPMRREDAAQMAEVRAKRSPQDQLDLLDKRLGVGVGAVRERKALAAQLARGKSKE